MFEERHELNHCQNRALVGHEVDWVIDFDVDEVLALGPPTVLEHNQTLCEKGKEGGELAIWASKIPMTVLAVVVPRLVFGQNGVVSHPHLSNKRTQMDLYTRRFKHTSGSKVMLRVSAVNEGTAKFSGKHWAA